MTPQNGNIDKKVNAIRQLLTMFKIERIIYLSVTILALIVLFVCAIYLLLSQEGTKEIPYVIGLFASGGAVTFTCSRLLKMWSDAIQLIGNIKIE